eukprot:3144472-Rhodomonas_salina.1
MERYGREAQAGTARRDGRRLREGPCQGRREGRNTEHPSHRVREKGSLTWDACARCQRPLASAAARLPPSPSSRTYARRR